MVDISIIIVTWNSEEEISNCLISVNSNIEYSKNLDIELIVIDNNSSDKTYEIVKSTNICKSKIYKNDTNLGFTKAVNQGINYSNGKYVLLLNPDTFLSENCIEQLYVFLEKNESYAAACPKLLNENGSIQYSIRNFPTYRGMYFEFYLLSYIFPGSRFFNRWKMEYFDYEKDSDVPQPMAAALMIRKEIFEKTGCLDEQFIMFFNDVELCKRIYDNGYKIRYLKDANAVHKKGASVFKDRIKMIKVWNKDCITYFKNYHNNFVLLIWLKISLKISSVFRIVFYKLSNK
jgi:GT2 family glycosyltransferase